MKRFACVWLPTFQIDRMRRACPQWVPQAQPFGLVESGPRGVCLTAVNHRAALNGIHAGQMLADARAVLPGLLTRAAEPDRDARMLNQLALWLGRYGPHRNIDGVDGLWVDITGVAHLFGGEAALARDCVDRFKRAGFQALMAIADTRSGAFALARYGPMIGQVAIAAPGEIRTALAELPIEGLQLTGDLVLYCAGSVSSGSVSFMACPAWPLHAAFAMPPLRSPEAANGIVAWSNPQQPMPAGPRHLSCALIRHLAS